MKTGPLTPLGSIKGDTWERIYDVTLTEAATSLTISGLDGDVDEEYILESKVVNGYNGGGTVMVRPNNDTGTNYGVQYVYGQSTSLGAGRVTNQTYFEGPGFLSSGQMATTSMRLFSKSGFVRTCLINEIQSVATTVVDTILLRGDSWNNTADNITSLVIAASQTGGLGVGSSFQLYRKTRRS